MVVSLYVASTLDWVARNVSLVQACHYIQATSSLYLLFVHVYVYVHLHVTWACAVWSVFKALLTAPVSCVFFEAYSHYSLKIQTTAIPDFPGTTLIISAPQATAASLDFTLSFRVPAWADSGNNQLTLNGKVIASGDVSLTPGTLASFNRTWADGDILKVRGFS